jgi:hypothetical protein
MADGTLVTKNTSGSTYSPGADWPGQNNDRMLFYALYPTWNNQTQNGTNIVRTVAQGTAAPKLEVAYTLSNEAEYGHYDLMYAYTGPQYRTIVPLVMKHALTRISFQARLAEPTTDGATVKIKRLQLKDVKSKGVLTVDKDGVATWALSDVPTDRRDYDFSLNDPTNSIVGNNRLKNVTLGEVTFQDILQVSTSASYNSLMLIPQQVDELLLELDIWAKKPNGTIIEEKNWFPLPPAYPWTMGKSLTYKLYVARDVIYIGAREIIWDHNTPDTTIPLEIL